MAFAPIFVNILQRIAEISILRSSHLFVAKATHFDYDLIVPTDCKGQFIAYFPYFDYRVKLHATFVTNFEKFLLYS